MDQNPSLDVEGWRRDGGCMEGLIIIIGLVVTALLAGRHAQDTHAEDTSAWWPGYGQAATGRARQS
jgi:hypothetical protein